jgi:hypothetical protein
MLRLQSAHTAGDAAGSIERDRQSGGITHRLEAAGANARSNHKRRIADRRHPVEGHARAVQVMDRL